MLKFTLRLFVLLVVLGAANTANAQLTILTENFEGTGIPAGWTKSQDTPSHGWDFGASTALTSTYFAMPAHTKFAASNDDKYDDTSRVKNKADRDFLITPSLNFSTLTAVTLTFDAFFLGSAAQYPDNSVATIEVSTDGGTTWNTAYTVPGSTNWQTLTADLSVYAGQASVLIGFKFNDGGNWSYGFAVDNVVVKQPANLQLDITALNIAPFVAASIASPATTPIKGTLSNFGALTITSATINWSVNGGAAQSENLSNLNIVTAGTYNFTLQNTISIPSPGTYNVKVWVTAPDNGTNADTTGTSLSTVINGMGGFVKKNVLIEEGTGAWCGYCIDGGYDADTITQAHSDVIAVSLHNQDGMATADDNTLTGQYITGFPGGMVDRVPFNGSVQQDRGVWSPDAVTRLGAIVPVSVGLYSTYDSAAKTINGLVLAKFVTGAIGDYRVNLYVCEDSVTGTGSGYDQHNYYSSSYSGNDPANPFYNLPSVVTGYKHMRVVRVMEGSAWGSTGVIPSTVTYNQEFQKQYTYTVPAGQNAKHMFLVALVQQYNTDANKRPIVNSVRGTLNGYTQTKVNSTYFATDTGNTGNGHSLVFQHGDTLYYQGGYLVFQLGDTVTINGTPTVITSTTDSIIVNAGDQVIVTGPNGAGSTIIPAAQHYTQYSYGTVTFLNVNGVNDLNADETFNVYPNPTDKQLTVKMNLTKGGEVLVTLSNIAGQQIHSFENANASIGENSLRIATGDLPTGVYILTVKTAQSSVSTKVVIAR